MVKELYRMLNFQDLGDERGKLVVIEGEEDTPFRIERCFYMYGTDSEKVRGNHANINSEFVLVNVAGKSKVMVTDGTQRVVVELNKPMEGLYIPKMIWKEMYDFSEDSVLLVMASTHFDESEYIRDYDEYIKIMEKEQ